MADLALTATSGTTTVPAGMYSATVRCIGPGGNGFNSASGAGGAYAEKTIAVTPGDVLSYQVGAGGSLNDTWFVSAATVMAKAGANATAFNAGGVAPAATLSVGQLRFKGGNGRNNGGEFGGLGGGGAGGPNGAGADGGPNASTFRQPASGGGAANGGVVGQASQSTILGGYGGNNRLATGGGVPGSGTGSAPGVAGTAGTGAGGGAAGSVTTSGDTTSPGGNGAQEDLWQVLSIWYGPGGGGGGAAGSGLAGSSNGYGGGGAGSGRSGTYTGVSGLGTSGLIIIDWSASLLQSPTSYATFIGL